MITKFYMLGNSRVADSEKRIPQNVFKQNKISSQNGKSWGKVLR